MTTTESKGESQDQAEDDGVRGLGVDIYRNEYRSPANVFGKFTRLTLVGVDQHGHEVAPIFKPIPGQAPAVVLGETTPGHVVAFPADKGNRHTMFGGSFIYTSDSRMPGRRPIPLHDRYEGDDWTYPEPDAVNDTSPEGAVLRAKRAAELMYPAGDVDETKVMDMVVDLYHLLDWVERRKGGVHTFLYGDAWGVGSNAFDRYKEERHGD